MSVNGTDENQDCLTSCLDNIVTVSDLCSGKRDCSLSGYDLMDAPEISIENLASIANEIYLTGLNLARQKVKQAVLQVKNDLIAVLNTNSITTDISAIEYNSSIFNPAIIIDPSAAERGISIFRSSKIRGKLKKIKVSTIEIYPSISAQTYLLVYDNNVLTKYAIDLTGGKVNSFDINYVIQGKYARFVIDDTALPMISATIKCGVGCDSSLPNDCAYGESYNGITETNQKEAYGINLIFNCECDYDQFLCDLSRTYVGELIWLKSRILLLDEKLYTSRMNNWIIYGRNETAQLKADLDAEYREKWNGLVKGMYGILKNYRDSCLECRGIRWVVND